MPVSDNDLRAIIEQSEKIIHSLKNDLPIPPPAKPSGWKKKTNAPYYREDIARNLIPFLNQMLTQLDLPIEDRKEIHFPLPEGKRRITLHSHNLKYYQAFRYVCEQLDPDGKYTRLRDLIEIRNEQDKSGVRLAWKIKSSAITAIEVAHEDLRAWRKRLDDFIESAKEGDVFDEQHLVLSVEDIEEIKRIFNWEDCPFYVKEVTKSKIKIIRIAQ